MRPLPTYFRVLALLMCCAATLGAQIGPDAKQLYEAGDYARAKEAFQAMQKADPRDAAVAYYLGRIAILDSEIDEAVRQLERAVRSDSTNALYHAWLGNALSDATAAASKIKQPFMAGRVRRAWERAVELDPGQLDARSRLVEYYAVVPGFMGGSLDRAREQASELAKRSPLRGALARGVIARQSKNLPAEEAATQEALTLAPDSIAGYLALSDFYAHVSKPDQGVAVLTRFLDRRPADSWGYFYLGRFASLNGVSLETGQSALKRFLDAPPTDAHVSRVATAHYHLGRLAERGKDKAAAKSHYETALKLNPKSQAAKRALKELK